MVLALLLYFFLLEAIDIRSGLLRVGKVATVTSMAILGLIDLVPAVSAPAAAAIGLTPNMSWGQANVMMAGQISISPLIGATFAMGDRAGSLGHFLRNDSGLCRPKGLSRTPYLRALRNGSATDFLAQDAGRLSGRRSGQYWIVGTVFAIPEPIQALSARRGVMLLCFPVPPTVRISVHPDPGVRWFVFAERVPCPSEPSPSSTGDSNLWRNQKDQPVV